MKKKTSSKFVRMALSIFLAITMIVPSIVFAQDKSGYADPMDEIATQSLVVSDEIMKANGSEADLNSLQDSTNFLSIDIPDTSVISISNEDIDRIALTDELDEIKVFKTQENELQIAEENFSIDVGQIMGERQSSSAARSFSENAITRAIGNNDPNSAIYLPPSYFGYMLSNSATNNEDWYYYEATANAKQTIEFTQQPNGQYIIALYKLNTATGILTQVNQSAYSGTSQLIEHIDTAGYYFLRILPLTAPTTSYNYNFAVYVSYTYDSHEFNDNPDTATPFANSVNITATIDNPFDEDWYKLTLTSTKDLDVTAKYGQANTYAVFLYDSNFNSKGSFFMDGVTRPLMLSAGTYYARAISYTGDYSDTEKYTLKMVEYVPPAPQPLGSFSIPWTRLESTYIYQIPTTLRVEPGSSLVFDSECYSVYGDSWARVGVIVDINYDGINKWERMGDFWISQGTDHHIYDLPYRMDHIVGRPLYPKGSVRITLVPDGTVEFTAAVTSMPY